MDYRLKQNARIVRFPKGFEEEQRGFKDCCRCKQLVLADPSATDTYKNDLTGVYVKKNDAGDIVTITMEDANGNVVSNQGFAATFPNDALAFGFVYQWQDVLNTHGAGCYTIKVNFTIAGITGGYTHGTYDLKPFSISAAKNTVRIRSKFRSKYKKIEVDFTDSNFTDSIRFNGLFGETTWNTEVENLVDKGARVVKTTREDVNQHFLSTDPLSVCMTRQIKFHLINEDECFISDHNPGNHDYLLFDVPVVLIESAEPKYIRNSRLATITATFGDRDMTDKSYYNKQ